MSVYPAKRPVYRTITAVIYYSREHTDDLTVCDSAFLIQTVVAAKDIAVFLGLYYPMKYISPVSPLIKRDIQSFERPFNGLYHQQIARRAYQRIHAVADMSIYQLSAFSDDILKGALIHQSHR